LKTKQCKEIVKKKELSIWRVSLLHIASRGWTATMPNCRFITSAACRAELPSKACWTLLPNSALRQLPISRTPAATHYLSVCSKGSTKEMCRQYNLLPKAIVSTRVEAKTLQRNRQRRMSCLPSHVLRMSLYSLEIRYAGRPIRFRIAQPIHLLVALR
jgi:hypothetical protein